MLLSADHAGEAGGALCVYRLHGRRYFRHPHTPPSFVNNCHRNGECAERRTCDSLDDEGAGKSGIVGRVFSLSPQQPTRSSSGSVVSSHSLGRSHAGISLLYFLKEYFAILLYSLSFFPLFICWFRAVRLS